MAADIQDIVAKVPAAGKEGKCLRSCLMKKYGAVSIYFTGKLLFHLQ